MEGTAGAAQREREIVRQTAELLSLGVPLADLFERFCLLLAEFVDASVVFIALRSESGIHIEFAYDHGLGLREAHVEISADSQTARVISTGESLLMCSPDELPQKRVPLNIPGAAIDDTASAIFVPLRFGASTIGVLSVQTHLPNAYDKSDLQLLETCALYVAVGVQAEQLRTQKERAEFMATVDAVTGAASRRVFDERIAYEWARARRSGGSLAAILMDVDFFKAFNDTYGHVAGDACLAQVAQAARACVSRGTDLFARYGGEEFCTIVCDVSPTAALGIAERMRAAVAALQIPHKHAPGGVVTASFGVACAVPHGDDARPLLHSADRALYTAKATGRNRAVLEGDVAGSALGVQPLGNLPQATTPFIGRALELEESTHALTSSRLTTIVGPGGAGKTRCAQAVARQRAQTYADGSWFVDFGTVRDPSDLGEALCAIFDVVPDLHKRPANALVDFLADKQCLLVFDNCEQIARAVGDLCEQLLAGCPRITILATSREPLKAAHEHAYRLGPLRREDAQALFVERATAAFPGIAFDADDRSTIFQLCERLDDLPLAIELAAPRVKTMSPALLLRALEERFEVLVSSKRASTQRQHTLEAAIGWSYDLLDSRAQRVFERLSAFAGSFDAGAARDICGYAPLRPGEAVTALDEIVEKNLAMPLAGGDRIVLLESMRDFARERLRDRGEETTTQRKHIAYFMALAERIGEQVDREMPQPAYEMAAREWPEFRAALDRAIAGELDLASGEGLVLALSPYWSATGRTHEASTWIARALERAPIDSANRADLVYAAALAAHSSGNFAALRTYAIELLDHAQRPQAKISLGAAYNALGNAEYKLGHPDEAIRCYQLALDDHRSRGDKRGVAIVLMNLAGAQADLHLDFDGARERFEEALAIFRDLGLSVNVGIVLANLGEVIGQMGRYERAIDYAEESLATFRRLNNRAAEAWQHISVAHYRLELGALNAARESLCAAQTILKEHPQHEYTAMLLEVTFYFAVDSGQMPCAARLAGYLQAYRERERLPRLPSAVRFWDARFDTAREALGRAQFEALFAAGPAATVDELLGEALR